MGRKLVTRRTAERLIRAAYEYEALAVTMRTEGWRNYANAVSAISSSLGDVGRSMIEAIENK